MNRTHISTTRSGSPTESHTRLSDEDFPSTMWHYCLSFFASRITHPGRPFLLSCTWHDTAYTQFMQKRSTVSQQAPWVCRFSHLPPTVHRWKLILEQPRFSTGPPPREVSSRGFSPPPLSLLQPTSGRVPGVGPLPQAAGAG